MHTPLLKCAAAVGLLTAAACVQAADASTTTAGLRVELQHVQADGDSKPAGQIDIHETDYGLVFTPSLKGLPPGLHGFHVHVHPSCAPGEKDGERVAAQAAGDHFDPAGSGQHGAPWDDGHLGDLPPLHVAADGSATQPVLAPRLKKLAELRGRSLMVHAGGDNHADHPKPLGGGGERLACGVIPAH